MHAIKGYTQSTVTLSSTVTLAVPFWQKLKQQCAGEVESVRVEVQHKQRQAARILKSKAEEEAIKVCLTIHILCPGFLVFWLYSVARESHVDSCGELQYRPTSAHNHLHLFTSPHLQSVQATAQILCRHMQVAQLGHCQRAKTLAI